MKPISLFFSVATLAAGAAWIGADAYAESEARKRIDQRIAQMQDVAEIRYEDVDVNLLSRDVSLHGVSVRPRQSREALLIERVVIDEFDSNATDVPAFMSLQLHKAEIATASLGTLGAGLRELDYPDKVNISLTADYHYDRRERQLDIRRLEFDLADAGSLSLALKLSNIELGSDETSLMRLLFGYRNLIIHNAELRLQDNSLAERILQQQAEEQGISADQVRSNALAALDARIADSEDPLSRETLTQLRQFIAEPDTLSASIRPEQPLKIRNIPRRADPLTIARMLNLQIKG
ncbi:hypothetical protein Q4485_14540 [Granulosicoccaceae sp. 1_MG-2023]|nr:hypothetical protein [Granulosicoccaceae sp. 1_MG-2023]